MEDKIKVFIGMVKGTSMFVIGQVVDQAGLPANDWLTLKNVVRIFEVATGENKIGYQFHPDPYFTNDKESELDRSDFLMSREEQDQDDKLVKEYKNFLTQFRMQRMGMVAGNLNPERTKQILKEIR